MARGVEWREVSGPVPAELAGHLVAIDEAGAHGFVGRMIVAGGSHPGVVMNGACATPYKGSVVRNGVYEVALDAKIIWCAKDWTQATPVGRQGKIETYFCRARISVGGQPVGWAYGKAYRNGTHANRAYLAWEGREVELLDGYELAKLESIAPPAAGP